MVQNLKFHIFFTLQDHTIHNKHKKNRFKSTFVNVPILLEFNTHKNPTKSFHIALGVIGGYKLGSRTRQILEQNGINAEILDAKISESYDKSTHEEIGRAHV